jgi:putative membrane protein
MNLLIKGAIFIAAVFVTDWLLLGIIFKTIEAQLLVAVCMAAFNLFIKPIIKIFAFPITLMTLGFFPLILNTVFVLLMAGWVTDFVIVGDLLFRFGWAFAFGFVLTVVTVIVEQVTGYDLPN